MSGRQKKDALLEEIDSTEKSDASKASAQPEKFRWTFSRTLALVGILLLTGFVIVIASSVNDNAAGLIAGLAFLPGTGIVITPIIIKSAIRESSTWEDRAFKDKNGRSFKTQLLNEDNFYRIEDTEPYHSRLLKGVIREALLNASVLIVCVFLLFICGIFALVGGPPSWMLGGVMAKKYMARAFIIVLVLVVFLVPILSYNITLSVCRIRTVKRREYFSYHAVVSKVELYEMDIKSQKNTANKRTYKFNYCKCLDIREKEINETKAVLLFVPDEVYLIPDDGRSY